MAFEELLRYTLPGYIALLPIIFSVLFTKENTDWGTASPFISAIVLLGPIAGLVLHEIHMLWYENTMFAFHSKKIQLIKSRINKNSKNADKLIKEREALLIYELFFHSEFNSPDTKQFILRTMYHIHSFLGMCWALGVGEIFLLSNAFFIKDTFVFYINLALGAVYLLSFVVLLLKSKSSQKLLFSFESAVIIKNWKHIKSNEKLVIENKKDIF